MSQKLIIITLIGFIHLSLDAQKLSFQTDGTFKIVQFTDMHYVHGNPNADTTLMLIPIILDSEKPDLVIFTGDVVTGSVRQGWNRITFPVIERGIPFAVTLGNHDHEQGMTREEIADIVTNFPFNVNKLSDVSQGRVMDNVIPIYNSNKSLDVAALIYCFDTGAYPSMDKVGVYDWITTKQVHWYQEQSLYYTVKNNFHPLPALAFFHIPLPEYRLAFNDKNNVRYGERRENECPPDLNSGMFLAMKEMGDVMGTFVGHDHVNDYIVDYFGIALAYGHFSGWRTTYISKINGARVIVLKKGKREFDTWLHQLDGVIRDKVSYPTEFINLNK